MISPEKEVVPLQKVRHLTSKRASSCAQRAWKIKKGYMYVLCTFIFLPSFQQVKARGNVENWLGLVEDSMVVSLRKLTKASLADFETKPRHIWATQHASQVILYILK